jgi:hypothetical protein
MTPRVRELLADLRDPSRVAERLRAANDLTSAERHASLRVLLEISLQD